MWSTGHMLQRPQVDTDAAAGGHGTLGASARAEVKRVRTRELRVPETWL